MTIHTKSTDLRHQSTDVSPMTGFNSAVKVSQKEEISNFNYECQTVNTLS
jgi:hypothetical protein